MILLISFVGILQLMETSPTRLLTILFLVTALRFYGPSSFGILTSLLLDLSLLGGFYKTRSRDENLRKRGCIIVSICVFCWQKEESAHHIFFDCTVTHRLWEWLEKGTEQKLDCTNCSQLILGRVGVGSKLV